MRPWEDDTTYNNAQQTEQLHRQHRLPQCRRKDATASRAWTRMVLNPNLGFLPACLSTYLSLKYGMHKCDVWTRKWVQVECSCHAASRNRIVWATDTGMIWLQRVGLHIDRNQVRTRLGNEAGIVELRHTAISVCAHTTVSIHISTTYSFPLPRRHRFPIGTLPVSGEVVSNPLTEQRNLTWRDIVHPSHKRLPLCYNVCYIRRDPPLGPALHCTALHCLASRCITSHHTLHLMHASPELLANQHPQTPPPRCRSNAAPAYLPRQMRGEPPHAPPFSERDDARSSFSSLGYRRQIGGGETGRTVSPFFSRAADKSCRDYPSMPYADSASRPSAPSLSHACRP
ncbi:hypothetical protein K431DRAFT_11869 [Polychaeton citri CBS 116435]|uniref:Uncharacterized protein n=1 Tax=Polychaeton citri CBS 116435 TaxID=1314669 RepID=A0A9P4PYY8_9PEZI|nr:hypothetical protein K431DRAFT_11869 [Polychaeton citri CBS 116435]